MWDEDASPNKAHIRRNKIIDISETIKNHKEAYYLGLPGPEAILENLIAIAFDPKKMYLLEKNPSCFAELAQNVSKGRLKGANLYRQEMIDFVQSSGHPKYAVVDLDFCGNPNKANIDTVVALAKNGLLSNRGLLFVNFCKGHDDVPEIDQIVASDPRLKDSLGLKTISRFITKEERKPYLDLYREKFIPKYLIRQFANYGYALSVKGDLQEYADSQIYMQQWTFEFKKVRKKTVLVAIKANAARTRMRPYLKSVRRKVK
jgi:hypothetical protein